MTDELSNTNQLKADEMTVDTDASHREGGGFEFHDFFLPSGEEPHNVVLVQSLETLLGLIGEGHGYSIQPAAAVTWNRPTPELVLLPISTSV